MTEEVSMNATLKIKPVESTVIKAGNKTPDSTPSLVRIKILKRFILNKDNHETMLFDPNGTNCDETGHYDVLPEDATHPYLLAHTDKAPPVEFPPGTLRYAEEQQRLKRQMNIEALAEKHNDSEALAEIKRKNLRELRERMGGDKSGLEDSKA
jgi:hypothetical protein